MGGRGGAWQSRKHSFCCCVPLRRCLASSETLSFSLLLRVAFSCHLSPPLSLIPLSACFSYALSQALSFYFLFLLVFSSYLTFSASPRLLHKAGLRYVSPFTYSKKAFMLAGLLVWVSCFSLFSLPLSFASFSQAALCPWQRCVL